MMIIIQIIMIMIIMIIIMIIMTNMIIITMMLILIHMIMHTILVIRRSWRCWTGRARARRSATSSSCCSGP